MQFLNLKEAYVSSLDVGKTPTPQEYSTHPDPNAATHILTQTHTPAAMHTQTTHTHIHLVNKLRENGIYR